jgi:hypothetical protein
MLRTDNFVSASKAVLSVAFPCVCYLLSCQCESCVFECYSSVCETCTMYLQAFCFLRYGTYFNRILFSMLGLLGMYSRSCTFNMMSKIPEILSTARIRLDMDWSQ